jgi:integrase
MASILRKPTSKFWFAAFRDAAGQQHRRTTGTTDRARAKRIAQMYEITAQKRGSPQKVRENFASLFKEFFGSDLPNATVRGFATRWLKDKEREIALSTREIYRKAVERFLEFLGKDADKDLALVTKNRITDHRNQLADRLGSVTVNRDLVILKMIFRRARIDGYITDDPCEGIGVLRRNGEQHSRRPFSIPELQAIIEVADPEWQSLIRFGLYTGQRLGDLARLTWNQIDTVRGEIRIVPQKTGKAINLPICEPLREHIAALVEGTDKPGAPVHPRAFGILKRNGRTGTLSNQFTAILAQVGLRANRSHVTKGKGRGGMREGSDIGFHAIRHTAVSLLKDARVPDAVVMELVGHGSAAMSQRYTHVGSEALTKAANALPKI